jgi:integrase
MMQTPFKIGTEVAIRLKREPPRQRRLEPGEGDRLLAACGPHLRAVVEAALETGMRRGEILSLQWWQVKTEPKAQIHLPAAKTKTSKDRWVPISARLQMILDMRRADLDGKEMSPHAFVFGNEVAEPVARIDRAWRRAVLEAHGYKAGYARRRKGEGMKSARTGGLDAESCARLKTINLHFHDLRREAGSRWLEGGVPLHIVRDWLGHTSVAQTSTYLAGTVDGQHEAMKMFDARRGYVQPSATESKKRGHERAQSATIENSRPQLSSENPQ